MFSEAFPQASRSALFLSEIIGFPRDYGLPITVYNNSKKCEERWKEACGQDYRMLMEREGRLRICVLVFFSDNGVSPEKTFLSLHFINHYLTKLYF
eukprot:snap_masked-scaffold_4-processed-gene-3.17-mRNA-1 protein AED:1.00 eAED:1.00 QI:0/0/0/0/1/1/2/0/95